MALPWAKFPVQWLKPSAAAVDGEKKYPMTDLQWSRYAGTSIGMVLVLIALSIRLNQSQKDMVFEKGQARGTCVAVTYKDLRHMTGLAKATISQALMLLEGFGALSVERAGRASSYRLIGLDVAGGWCQLPQSWLLNRDGTLKLKKLPRNRLALNALKAYLLLMALRDRQLNTAAVSYTAIEKWTGIRREEISNALGTLTVLHMASVSPDRDFRHSRGDNSHRYSVVGLGNSFALRPDVDMTNFEITPEAIVHTSPDFNMITTLFAERATKPLSVSVETREGQAKVVVTPDPSVLGAPAPPRPGATS